MKNILLARLYIVLCILLVNCLIIIGCAGISSVQADASATAKTAPTLTSYAQTLYRALQTANGLVKTAQPALDVVAAAWGVQPATIAQANLYNDTLAQVAAASGNQAKVTAILQAVVDSTTPHAMYLPSRFKITTGLRPIFGWVDPYNVELARK